MSSLDYSQAHLLFKETKYVLRTVLSRSRSKYSSFYKENECMWENMCGKQAVNNEATPLRVVAVNVNKNCRRHLSNGSIKLVLLPSLTLIFRRLVIISGSIGNTQFSPSLATLRIGRFEMNGKTKTRIAQAERNLNKGTMMNSSKSCSLLLEIDTIDCAAHLKTFLFRVA